MIMDKMMEDEALIDFQLKWTEKHAFVLNAMSFLQPRRSEIAFQDPSQTARCAVLLPQLPRASGIDIPCHTVQKKSKKRFQDNNE